MAVDIAAVRCSEELLEAIGRQRRCLRKEREDPAAIVVDDDDAQVGTPAGQGRQRTAVVEEGDVADDGDGRLPVRGRCRGRWTSRRRCRWHPRLAWATARRPPNHSRSRTGIDEATTSRTPSGRCSATARATPGSESACSARSMSSIACSASAAASIHRRNHGDGVDGGAARPTRASIDDAGRSTATRWSGSITRGPPTCTTVASLAGDPRGEHLRRGGTTDAHDDVRDDWRLANSSTRTIASKAVTAAGRWRQPDDGSASTGQPVAFDNASTSSRTTPLRPPARISPRSAVSSSVRPSGCNRRRRRRTDLHRRPSRATRRRHRETARGTGR